VLAQKPPQYLRCGRGAPVLPEVKPIATSVSAGITGGGQHSATGAGFTGSSRQSMGRLVDSSEPVESASQTACTPSKASISPASVAALRDGGSSVGSPRISAAAKPSRKR